MTIRENWNKCDYWDKISMVAPIASLVILMFVTTTHLPFYVAYGKPWLLSLELSNAQYVFINMWMISWPILIPAFILLGVISYGWLAKK